MKKQYIELSVGQIFLIDSVQNQRKIEEEQVISMRALRLAKIHGKRRQKSFHNFHN